ncbi:MAG: serine hydrolase [Bacteroidota bacterium]
MRHPRRACPLLFFLILILSGYRVAAQTPAPLPDIPLPDIKEQIETMMKAYAVEGLAVVVVRDQETLLSSGLGVQADGTPYTSDTPNGAYSATKALSSFVYASLVEEGLLDLDAPIGQLLDDAPAAWADIPFWRLLNHTSGITMIVNRPEFEHLEADPTTGNAEIYRILRPHPLDYAPGKASRYRQSGYAVAEMILEQQLGQTWPALVEDHLTGPAGATATVHAQLASGARTTPLIASAGGYQTTADDMAALFRALNAGQVVAPAFLEDLLYRDAYTVNGYSLGSILDVIDGVRTLGHQGGGARATVRYVPSRRVGVAVFTHETANYGLALHVADLLVRAFALGQQPKLPISAPLLEMRTAPASDIVAFYEAASAQPDPAYDFTQAEWILNQLGYLALSDGRIDDAITVFSLNVRAHPGSANVHDSLGEAYFEQGDLDRAHSSYRRALELDPSSVHAQTMIERINKQRQEGGGP